MASRPSSPFAALDKALLRETRQHPAESSARSAAPVEAIPDQTSNPPAAAPVRPKRRASASERPYARTGVRRVITRYAFEFYQDQLEQLREIALNEKLDGGKGSMSEMVRDALDQYLARRRREGR